MRNAPWHDQEKNPNNNILKFTFKENAWKDGFTEKLWEADPKLKLRFSDDPTTLLGAKAELSGGKGSEEVVTPKKKKAKKSKVESAKK